MELIVIFLVILVLFGPRRLPEIAKMVGKTLHELRRASEDFKDQVMSIDTDAQDADVPPSPVDEVVKDVYAEESDEALPMEEGDIALPGEDDDAALPKEEGDEACEEHHDLAG
jgi:TatA/E family protein of Tat protein translocase